jgi:hypothetical protein
MIPNILILKMSFTYTNSVKAPTQNIYSSYGVTIKLFLSPPTQFNVNRYYSTFFGLFQNFL